ncbi:MAG TPA: hypothetical protein VIM60_01535 [Edaphobacter sp.]
MKQPEQDQREFTPRYDVPSLEQHHEDLRQRQNNILVEDQIRNDFRMMGEAAERSAPRNRIEQTGWFVIAFVNAAAAVALASMMLEDRFYPGLLIVGVFLIFSYKLFRKAFRRS